ncbi:DUF6415 family natural product biosynthesis protein [Streptomyces sp. NRRL S-1022]|uniref:DUF6415 family natural product biosynthesis protein n=1 Tax=Streptomyces sp. NRRL S-1022 TaxID=1463880 RepID=UPI0004BE9B89|nr:DUF6415 family natural product biosynthesis protein [Streptomyces sp. NRRL S-1022]
MTDCLLSPPADAVAADVDLDRARKVRDEVVQLTKDLPAHVPPRAQLEPAVAELRVYVEDLVCDVGALIATEEDPAERQTAQWLLGRDRQLLEATPAATDLAAAVHAQDMALCCRALAGLYERQTKGADRAPED